ncbi:unnamed protein product [Arabidopsis thaliana]|uniref:Uncharacterized protein n=1 Tax=Arabidopsis thaliana TaxID=3702 RepID=A0A5S9WYN0_ARATH|nr:unnamed protein product [Arabidopsis thaliana]
MVHLATIPITGTGINPAKSFGTARYNLVKFPRLAWDPRLANPPPTTRLELLPSSPAPFRQHRLKSS